LRDVCTGLSSSFVSVDGGKNERSVGQPGGKKMPDAPNGGRGQDQGPMPDKALNYAYLSFLCLLASATAKGQKCPGSNDDTYFRTGKKQASASNKGREAMQQIAFLGLGTMGTAMARNISKAGFPLIVYNRTRAKAEALATSEIRLAQTPREAAQQSDVIISMVGNDQASQQIWLGEEGALDGARPNAVLIECSTLSLAWVRQLAELAASRHLAFLDSPVTGSLPAAQAGHIGLFVGGNAAAFQRVQPVLQAMSQFQSHLGASGAGAKMKLVINLIIGLQAEALAEGLNLAAAAGLNMEQVVALLANGGVGSPVVKMKIEPMVQRQYTPHFALRWLHKDLTYALRLADEVNMPMPALATVREIYRLAGNLGLDEADFSAVIEALRQSESNVAAQ
jgi:3-hydroxyisobutyrate dehydrogenase